MNYALIENGVVVNIIWCNAANADEFGAISVGDRAVAIGDSYADGRFYRDGKEILTVAEQLAAAQVTIADLAEYAAELEYQNALTELGMEV